MDCFKDFFFQCKNNVAVDISDTFPGAHTFLECGGEFWGHRDNDSEGFCSRD